jgi:hypothetical protein
MAMTPVTDAAGNQVATLADGATDFGSTSDLGDIPGFTKAANPAGGFTYTQGQGSGSTPQTATGAGGSAGDTGGAGGAGGAGGTGSNVTPPSMTGLATAAAGGDTPITSGAGAQELTAPGGLKQGLGTRIPPSLAALFSVQPY